MANFTHWLSPLVLLACLLSTASPAQSLAAAAAQLPAEAFFKHPDVLDAKLSPTGSHLAFTTAAGAERVALVVFDLAPGGRAVRAALFTDADVVRFSWVGQRRMVFSVADLASGSGEDQYAAPGLYGVDADGSDLRMLVARRAAQLVVVAQSRLISREALSWNHLLLHVPSPQPGADGEEVIVGQVNFIRGNDVSQIVPMWLNARTGRTRSIDLQAPAGSVGWMFDSRGEARVAVTRQSGRQAVHWRGPGQTGWTLLSDSEQLRAAFTPPPCGRCRQPVRDAPQRPPGLRGAVALRLRAPGTGH